MTTLAALHLHCYHGNTMTTVARQHPSNRYHGNPISPLFFPQFVLSPTKIERCPSLQSEVSAGRYQASLVWFLHLSHLTQRMVAVFQILFQEYRRGTEGSEDEGE